MLSHTFPCSPDRAIHFSRADPCLDVCRCQGEQGTGDLAAFPACFLGSAGKSLEVTLQRHLAIEITIGVIGRRGRQSDHAGRMRQGTCRVYP